ncbi:calcium homeostasis modulator protein 5-like [Saccoglossus kowalevskii]
MDISYSLWKNEIKALFIGIILTRLVTQFQTALACVAVTSCPENYLKIPGKPLKEIVMDQLKYISKKMGNIVTENNTTLTNILIALTTVGSEEIFQVTVFSCPCTNRSLYGFMFIFSPAFFLLCLGILINNRTWEIVNGCCRIKALCGGHATGQRCLHLCQMVAKSCLAPSVWIFVSFMDGKYYACAKSIAPCDVPDTVVLLSNQDKAVSHVIGWVFAVVCVVIVVLSYCLNRCFDRFTYAQRRYAIFYNEEENEMFDIRAKDLAKKEVDMNTKKFFSQDILESEPPLTDDVWRDVKKAWDSITIIDSRYGEKRGYTPLYHWAKFEAGEEPDKETPQMEMTSILPEKSSPSTEEV